MEYKKRPSFVQGLMDGVPICMGYLPVSFTFGMMAVEGGLPVWAAMLISLTNFTSAGQFAGTALILSGGMYLEIAVTTFIINIRYMLMALSLSQKIDSKVTYFQRCALSFGNTDEIFVVAMQQKGNVTAGYFFGLVILPYFAWSMGTFLGAAVTGFLPMVLRSALGIVIYGMFIAILIPPSKKIKSIAFTVILSMIISCLFKWTPGLKTLSSGWIIIICAVLTAGTAAYLFPVSEGGEES